MAACASVVAAQWCRAPHLVAAAPYAGSATPAVIVDGLLEGDIDWTALRGAAGTRADAKARLFPILLKMHLNRFTEAVGVFCSVRHPSGGPCGGLGAIRMGRGGGAEGDLWSGCRSGYWRSEKPLRGRYWRLHNGCRAVGSG